MGKAKQSNKIVPTKGPFTSIALKSLESLPPPNSSPVRLPFHSGPRFPLSSPSAPSFDHPISSRLYPGPHLAPITFRDRRHIHQSHLPYHEHNEFCSPPPPYNPLTPNETPPETINTATSRDSFGSAASTAAFPPPLPPRGKVLVGRHAARFDVKTPKSSFGKGDDARSHHKRGNNAAEMDSVRIRKKFLHPMMQSRRHCTDVLCCFIFVVFVVAWLVVAAFGFLWGKPEHLLHPTNSNGALCGVERKGFYDLRSKPYLLYYDITKCLSYATVFAGCQTGKVCVSKCPNKTFTYLQLQTVPSGPKFEKEVRENVICDDEHYKATITNFNELHELVKRGVCAPYTVPSAAVLGRCIPQAILNLGSAINQLQAANSSLDRLISVYGDGNGLLPSDKKIANTSRILGAYMDQKTMLEKIAFDMSATWWQILAFFIITALVALVWVIGMRLLGRYVVWVSILLIVAILGAGSGYCWYRYKILFDAGAITDYSFQPDIGAYFEMPTTWMIIAIILSVLFLIVLIILVVVRARIRLAVALIEESSKAIGSMMSALFFPILPFALHLLVFVLWATVTIWLSSSGTENCLKPRREGGNLSDGIPCDCTKLGTGTNVISDCEFVNMTRNDQLLFGMQAFNLFGFFWISCFVSALANMTLAGAFASYYWAFNKPKDVPAFPITRSLGRAVRYHLGTIAFGSLILAIVKFFRAILDYLDRKLSNAQNALARVILLCMKCFFWCLEAFLRFLTRNAYIMTAIYGKNFCTAARDSFMLITQNIVRYAVLDKVTDFLLFLGKITISLGMGVVAFYWFSGRWVIDGLPHIDLYYFFVPIIIVVIGGYFIADSFFDVYEMAVHTTFLCFLEDAEQNNGTPDKPYYMSKELQRILGKQNQFNAQTK